MWMTRAREGFGGREAREGVFSLALGSRVKTFGAQGIPEFPSFQVCVWS